MAPTDYNSSRIRAAASRIEPPRPRRREKSFVLHGIEHRDDYAYLSDPGLPQTQRLLKAESKYFSECMSAVSDSRARIYEELRSRMIETESSVPEAVGGYAYYTRVEAGKQYPIHCRRAQNGDGPEEVYLDENLLAQESSYCDVSVVAVCPEHRRFACAVDRTGDERYDILVASMEEGKLAGCATGAGDSIAWSRDGRVLLYTDTDDNARPESVWALDLETGERRRLYLESDPAFHVSVWLSRSADWLLIDSAGNTCSETRVLPATEPFGEPVTVLSRREEIEYSVEPHEDRFLVLINDTAHNFRLVETPQGPACFEQLIELIPPDEELSIEFVDAYRNHLVIGRRRLGVQEIMVWDLVSGSRRNLPGLDPLCSVEVEDLYDYDADYVRFEYSTPVQPHSTYDFDVATGRCTWRKTSTPPGYDRGRYAAERRFVERDGVAVPLTLVYRLGDLARDGSAPVLLTGYGAYEESLDTEFDSDLISLLDRGVVMALAHVRGGGDLGPGWHEAGRMGDKQNSFSDFAACAGYLVEQGITAPGRIAAWGASAGGLLVAAAVNRQPEIFASAVLEVPFLDVLNTLLDPDLPLTEYDFDEFGDPSDPREYRWLSAYSPYENIRAQGYPPMLLTAALNDQRVGYWEALKWTARLRATKTDDNPVLLKIDATGHLGESGRYGAVYDTALVYTFLLDVWGLLPEPARVEE